MTYYELCEKITGYKKSDSIHKFCSWAKWYCNCNKLEFNKTNIIKAFEKYKKTIK